MRKASLLLVLLSLFLLASHISTVSETISEATPTTAKPSLTLGIFPRRNAKTTLRIFQPLAEYLSEKLQRKVTVKTGENFKAFWDEVTAQKYDIVHYNQYHYIVSRQQWGYDAIAKSEEFGEAYIGGALVVRKDSDIKTIADLKGKKIIFGGGPRAMQSYIVARYLLEREGLSKNDYQTLFSIDLPSALYTTFYKQTDATGIGDKILALDIVKRMIDTEQLIFLAKSEPLPQLPWAVKASMAPELRNIIQTLLVNLKESEAGRKILKQARLTGLITATDAEYNKHREIIRAVYGDDYQVD